MHPLLLLCGLLHQEHPALIIRPHLPLSLGLRLRIVVPLEISPLPEWDVRVQLHRGPGKGTTSCSVLFVGWLVCVGARAWLLFCHVSQLHRGGQLGSWLTPCVVGWLMCWLLACLAACMLLCLPTCFLAGLLVSMSASLPACLLASLPAFLSACLLVCMRT